MDLRGRRAVVTGSTSGIGLGIAEALAMNGCDIVLNGFGTDAAIRAVRTQMEQSYDVRVVYLGADVSQPEECQLLIERALACLGGVDILVNNAGIQHVAPIERFPKERWDAILATNLSAVFHLTAAALPGMRASGYGRILNIASVHGLVGSRDKSAYVAAKHGVVGLTKVVALETAGQGVTCNAICPGWVLTPLVEAQLNERMDRGRLDRHMAEKALLSEKQPSGQFTSAGEIGSLAVFLCSDAAANITGATLPVDGGWTAQ